MTDNSTIDLRALEAAAPIGRYANAFRAGQGLAAVRPPAANAFAPPAMARGSPATSILPAAVANAATGSPGSEQDPAAIDAALAAMSGPRRLAAARQADKLAAVGMGLRSLAYGERRAVLTHMGPALARNGLDPAAIASFDPTNEALDAQVATAMGLKSALEATPADGGGVAATDA